MTTYHELKAIPESFELLAQKISEVQLRKNDRNFKVGDMCTFYEWLPDRGYFSGRTTAAMPIVIVLENHEGLSEGWCLIVLKVPGQDITRWNPKLCAKPTLTGVQE